MHRAGSATNAGHWLPGGGWDNRLVKTGDITVGLVSSLVGTQFPRWAGLPVRPVRAAGVDNVTFRLGEELAVRLPSGPEYVPGVVKEQRWLPVLAGRLPLPIPELVAVGEPGCGFPWPWSVLRWIDGVPLTDQMDGDLPSLAADLAGFLAVLYRIDPVGGPPPGPHNFFRGGPLTVYDGETQEALAALTGHIDTALAAEVWQAAVKAPGPGSAVWFPRRRPAGQPADQGRAAVRSYRLRHLRRRRPGLRHHHRLDVPVRQRQPHIHRTAARR